MFRSLLTLMLFVLVAMAANPVMSGSDSVPEPAKLGVVEECELNWNNSSASNTCSNASIVEVLNERCRITADCRNNSGGSGSTWKTMDPDQAGNLVNCNGTLKLNNC